MLKFGKKPARDAVKLKFGSYFDAAALPQVPQVFGKLGLINTWQMFSNDTVGDCVWAGAAHETMLWNAEAGVIVSVTDRTVLSDYSAATGYDPSDPSTDQGSDLQEAAAYRVKTGIADANGARHKIAAYVALEVGNLQQVALGSYLFGAVGVGIQFPAAALAQFQSEEPWTPVAGDHIEGGHYVPIVGRNSAGNFICVTWGRLHAVTPAFLSTYMDEGLAYLSFEQLKGNVSPRGFDAATLQTDLALLNGDTNG